MTKRICDVEDCDNQHLARGMCPKHYMRAKTAGQLEPRDPTSHFLSDVDVDSTRATCAICGPGVEIVLLSKGTVPCCAIKRRADNAKRNAARRAESPEQKAKRREYHRKYNRAAKYKIKVEIGLHRLLDAAGWKCEICSTPLTERTARIDHDHACCDSTHATCGSCVRGILCNSCNTGLGLLADDSRRLARAIEYLGGQLPLTA